MLQDGCLGLLTLCPPCHGEENHALSGSCYTAVWHTFSCHVLKHSLDKGNQHAFLPPNPGTSAQLAIGTYVNVTGVELFNLTVLCCS